MIIPRVCVDIFDMRMTVRTHLDEFIREMQEVSIYTDFPPHTPSEVPSVAISLLTIPLRIRSRS